MTNEQVAFLVLAMTFLWGCLVVYLHREGQRKDARRDAMFNVLKDYLGSALRLQEEQLRELGKMQRRVEGSQ